MPLIAIENKGIVAALERSMRLAWNHWLRIFLMQMTPWFCYLIFLSILKFIFRINVHIYFTNTLVHPLWTSVLQMIIFALFIPWVAAILLVQLKDLELRKHIVT